MAKKKYDFTITLQMAQCDGMFFTIVYGGPDACFKRENVTMTLDEAIAYRDQLSAQEERTHSASIRMTYQSDRAAPGINKLAAIQKVGIETRLPTYPSTQAVA